LPEPIARSIHGPSAILSLVRTLPRRALAKGVDMRQSKTSARWSFVRGLSLACIMGAIGCVGDVESGPMLGEPAGEPLTSSGTWQYQAIPTQTGAFGFEFDATPSLDTTENAVMGLSAVAPAAYTDLAVIVRFYNGHIDARSGSVYTSASSIPFTRNTSYHFRL